MISWIIIHHNHRSLPASDHQSLWWLPQLTEAVRYPSREGFGQRSKRASPNRRPQLHPHRTVYPPLGWVSDNNSDKTLKINQENIWVVKWVYLSIVKLKCRQMKSSGHRLWPVDWKDVTIIAGQRPPHPEQNEKRMKEAECVLNDHRKLVCHDESDSLETG